MFTSALESLQEGLTYFRQIDKKQHQEAQAYVAGIEGLLRTTREARFDTIERKERNEEGRSSVADSGRAHVDEHPGASDG